MELIHGRHKPCKFAPDDVISNMQDIVITNILNRLPLQEAVRTSVLSRNWRFNWTLLSEVVFDDSFFAYLSKAKAQNSHIRIISRILLHLRGDITKFVISIDGFVLDAEDVNHWILFLSRKGIKDLTINNRGRKHLLLPTHIFSCLELKHLKLYDCCFSPPHGFHGFPYLLSLELRRVHFEISDFGEFLTRCCLLESLNLLDLTSTCKVKLVETAKLENLKILSCDIEPMAIASCSTILELVCSLPKLQELELDFLHQELTEDGAKKLVPTTIPCLKVLKLSDIDLDDDMKLSCAFELIRSFPNLQTLEITTTKVWDDDREPASLEVDYNTTRAQLQLRNVDLTTCCHGSENDVWLIKYLLACSPFLKKFVIHFHELSESDEKLTFAKKLFKLQRGYPKIDIDIEGLYTYDNKMHHNKKK